MPLKLLLYLEIIKGSRIGYGKYTQEIQFLIILGVNRLQIEPSATPLLKETANEIII